VSGDFLEEWALDASRTHQFEQDEEFRNSDSALVRDFGQTEVRRLRQVYGSTFAPGCRDDDKVVDVVANLHALSLWRLVKDYHSGALTSKMAAPPRRRGGPVKRS
jgi:hypothetical protein